MRTFLAAPGYGSQTAAAGRGIWRARRDMSDVAVPHIASSLLAANFNGLWCSALNEEFTGNGVDYFAMIHSDVGPDDYWLDVLIEEMEEKNLDVLGVAIPIKDDRGLTSLCIDDGSTWRPKQRITMRELSSLPETFTSDDVNGPLLINTGCWVCRFDLEWATKVKFTVNDRIVFNGPEERYQAEVEPEDWYFSRLCHELGLRIGATRKVSAMHRGEVDFSNQNVWGKVFDDQYGATEPVVKDLFPLDIEGWLRPDEGLRLAELSKGKDVLEIGSYCGRSTVCIARTAKSVACVDYWDGRATPMPQSTYGKFLENVGRYNVKHKISEFAPEDDLPVNRFDLAFIDGDHSEKEVKQDIAKAERALRPNGLLVFHDYHSADDPGVTTAVDEYLASGAELLETVKNLAVVRPPVSVTTSV